jgi:hypothetical protein
LTRTLSAEELSRDVESLAADNDNLLAVEELLGHDGGQTAKEMALAVNDDLRFESAVLSDGGGVARQCSATAIVFPSGGGACGGRCD